MSDDRWLGAALRRTLRLDPDAGLALRMRERVHQLASGAAGADQTPRWSRRTVALGTVALLALAGGTARVAFGSFNQSPRLSASTGAAGSTSTTTTSSAAASTPSAAVPSASSSGSSVGSASPASVVPASATPAPDCTAADVTATVTTDRTTYGQNDRVTYTGYVANRGAHACSLPRECYQVGEVLDSSGHVVGGGARGATCAPGAQPVVLAPGAQATIGPYAWLTQSAAAGQYTIRLSWGAATGTATVSIAVASATSTASTSTTTSTTSTTTSNPLLP